MKLLNHAHQLLNTKSKGATVWVMGLFSMVFLMILTVFVLQLASFKAASDDLEDALAGSNLASALIDIEAYGINHSLIIADALRSYDIYKHTLATNLSLDDSENSRIPMIISRVVVEKYCIYNVYKDYIEEIQVSDEGIVSISKENIGQMYAPNGQLVESTGVYSELSFWVKGFFGIDSMAHKGKLVEVNTIYE